MKYTIRLNLDKLAVTRDEFITLLQERGVGTSVHFIPIPLHPFFVSYANLPQNQCPEALALYPRIISLPLYPAMSESDVVRVADVVKDLAHSCKSKSLTAAGGY